MITPFPGDPAANLSAADRANAVYGVQPGSSHLVKELAETMHLALQCCEPHALGPAAKACLRGYLCEPGLLNTQQKEGDSQTYRRHLLYAAPDRSFSILALVWRPGQRTPVHGHTAWGAAGVLEGRPYSESFSLYEAAPRSMALRADVKHQLKPGDIATVEPGIGDIHRIGNDSRGRAITVHIYGRDLLARPGSINIMMDQL